MGKKQHSKDRLYITSTEWATEWGGNKRRDIKTPFKRLPYYCCALTFTPFENPVCTSDGHVFDILHIIPYIQKHGKNPVTGAPLAIKDLITLNFHKNADGEYQCPVLNKVFTEFTHIVAIKTTGNVYCHEAVRELNLKPKNLKDLLTDEPFTREDIMTIQDPNKLDAKVLSEFDHVQKDLALEDEEEVRAREDPTIRIKQSADMKRMLQELGTERARATAASGGGGAKAQLEREEALKALEKEKKRARDGGGGESREVEGSGGKKKGKGGGGGGDGRPAPDGGVPALSIVDRASASLAGRSAAAAKNTVAAKAHAFAAAHVAGDRVPIHAKLVQSRYSSGASSRSFTSTAYSNPVTGNDVEWVLEERNPKKKGYVRLNTNLGDVNLELHCDLAPRACENFITHCENGYYTGVKFHRSIKNFMIQGGDPTGTGRGGESIWGKPFKDEFDSRLQHSGRGVLSMANSGPFSNGSQFFILFKSATHLDNKHTVFGRVVGGVETLSAMEKVPVDDEDRPKTDIVITGAVVFVNPYTEPDEEEEKAKKKAKEEATAKERGLDEVGQWYSNPTSALGLVENGKGVGKYLNVSQAPSKVERRPEVTLEDQAPPLKKKKEVTGVQFGSFSDW